jgi:pimeloyl-ACP methyl ester carboxylesterase
MYALEHPDLIERLMVLNTPLSKKSKLRPELAAYKSPLPFLRPGKVRFTFMMSP